jgi:2-amino-4-hydroxy-6-hydroxymethyldihydropteridine diphosphokinase
LSTVYLGLGSNLGDRLGHLVAGLAGMQAAGLEVQALSSVWATEPVGGPPQPAYLNAAAGLRTRLGVREVLAALQAAEVAAGRRRTEPNAPRPLDLDILIFGNTIIDGPDLVIPHPRLAERRFVLVPLAEIAPEVLHPTAGCTIRTLLARCGDPHRVEFYCNWPGHAV